MFNFKKYKSFSFGMNMTELVSIIISIFNMDTTILRSIKSFLVQTYDKYRNYCC